MLIRLGQKYKRAEFEALCSEFLDTASSDAVFAEFMTRYPVDADEWTNADGELVDEWEVHFTNDLRMYGKNYLQLLRVETTEIDPMVSDYMERWIKDVNNTSVKGDSTATTNNTVSNTTTGSNGSTVTSNDSSDGNTSNKNESISVSDSRDVNSAMPMNNSYTTGSTNERFSNIPGLNWNALSSQNESDNKGKVNDNGTTTSHSEGSGTTTTSGENNSNSESTTTGTVVNASNSSTLVEGEHKERYSGRHEAPQDMLKRASDYFRTTNALKWLCEKLDRNFTRLIEW